MDPEATFSMQAILVYQRTTWRKKLVARTELWGNNLHKHIVLKGTIRNPTSI